MSASSSLSTSSSLSVPSSSSAFSSSASAMRFLCLHGKGSKARILSFQLQGLRNALGEDHTYDYYEGTVVCPPGREVRDYGLLSEHEETYQYLVDGQERSISLLHGIIMTLRSYILRHGPYDGIIGYAQGAFVASMLVIHSSCSPMPPLKLAIFLSMDRPPFDMPCHLPGLELRPFERLRDKMSIEIPTAHIWGYNDDLECLSSATALFDLCEETGREKYIHRGGREVPRSHCEDTKPMADCIKTTILRAYQDYLIRVNSNSPDPNVAAQSASY